MPNSKIILTDYEAKKRKNHANQKKNHQGLISEQDMSALEHNELEGPMIREFAIHILQSIHFLQNMDPIEDEEVNSRKINLQLKKIGVCKWFLNFWQVIEKNIKKLITKTRFCRDLQLR